MGDARVGRFLFCKEIRGADDPEGRPYEGLLEMKNAPPG